MKKNLILTSILIVLLSEKASFVYGDASQSELIKEVSVQAFPVAQNPLVAQNVVPVKDSLDYASWKKTISSFRKFFTKEDLKYVLVQAQPEKYLACEDTEEGYSDISYSPELVQELSRHTQTDDLDRARCFAQLAYNPDLENSEPYSLTNIKNFTGKTGLFSSSQSHCGFVAEEGENFIVSIRGTRMTSLNDWGTNFNTGIWDGIQDQELLGISGQVHPGFYHYGKSVFENLWPDLLLRMNSRLRTWIQNQASEPSKEQINQAYIDILKNANFQVHGHSLGGAAAHIVALMIKKALKDIVLQIDGTQDFDSDVNLFTFESPRVFNKKAAAEFEQLIGKENHVRVIQKNPSAYIFHTDPVTAVSLGTLGFQHTGTLFVKEIETEEDKESAQFHLHSMAPIDNVAQGFEKGAKNVSMMKKIFGFDLFSPL